ncbi:T-cell surface glycoprotein CD3 epsilon chain isoform X1 [Gopherus flavomarginatus]|uniref:T-cell surface glycoprotein CD3 epsilon chain isoform X1 n=1 Tax=Gopherus flavomarginatus TaxID=286002 RepID=UPI0021CBBA2F|nr:T-cell surface glycoprotein CD3 epsilon chain isoform X1 [Gopherus flavomarginatus]XP_050778128.1 T-cell surface glycoprotein CD3 epsilon chain isoform X1 [Gopherus flavomarginatus]
MKLEVALPVLGLLLCVADTMAQENQYSLEENPFEVVISKTKVTITCPLQLGSGIKWKKGEEQEKGGDQDYVIEEYKSPKDDGDYMCKSGPNSARLHLKAKVCRNCEELDVLTVAGVIIADLLITLGVLILVYYFSKNRTGRVGGSAGVHPRGPKMVRPPPVPNPDYEPIRKGQRDVYAGLQSRGF